MFVGNSKCWKCFVVTCIVITSFLQYLLLTLLTPRAFPVGGGGGGTGVPSDMHSSSDNMNMNANNHLYRPSHVPFFLSALWNAHHNLIFFSPQQKQQFLRQFHSSWQQPHQLLQQDDQNHNYKKQKQHPSQRQSPNANPPGASDLIQTLMKSKSKSNKKSPKFLVRDDPVLSKERHEFFRLRQKKQQDDEQRQKLQSPSHTTTAHDPSMATYQVEPSNRDRKKNFKLLLEQHYKFDPKNPKAHLKSKTTDKAPILPMDLDDQQQQQQQQQQKQQSDYSAQTSYQPRTTRSEPLVVKTTDYIMNKTLFDASPIVVKEYKLVFFTIPKVGCTVWKQLFRKIKGYPDWKVQHDWIHDPQHNGLTYLADYSPEEALTILTSPEWTKAMFVRDPKERFLSAYLDKAVSNFGLYMIPCCEAIFDNTHHALVGNDVYWDEKAVKPKRKKNNRAPVSKYNNPNRRTNPYAKHYYQQLESEKQMRKLESVDPTSVRRPQTGNVTDSELINKCVRTAQKTMTGFFRLITKACPNNQHWLPQSQRVDAKYWPVLSSPQNSFFVGQMSSSQSKSSSKSSTLHDHAEVLLKRIGAWEEHGQTGWGVHGNDEIFSSRKESTMNHATNSKEQFYWYYNTKQMEQQVDEYYQADYEVPVLQLTPTSPPNPADNNN